MGERLRGYDSKPDTEVDEDRKTVDLVVKIAAGAIPCGKH